MLDILNTIDTWLAGQRPIALATVIETWGSSPRQAGAKMGIAENMAMIGSVSGGCVETAVVSEALDSLEDQQPRLLNFGVSDDVAWNVGLSCGGKISVYTEPLNRAWWEAAAAHVKADQAMVTAVILAGANVGDKVLVDASGGEAGVIYASPTLSETQRDMLTTAAKAALNNRQPARAMIG